jgi:hypothetical protein
MATFERTSPLKLERQLDGSASQSVDCGVAACVMALDDASYGLIRPSTEAVRRRMGNDRDATNPDQWKAAIDSYAERFADSTPIRSPIPRQSDQPFQGFPITPR